MKTKNAPDGHSRIGHRGRCAAVLRGETVTPGHTGANAAFQLLGGVRTPPGLWVGTNVLNRANVSALCTRSGKRCDGKSCWTNKHEDWLLKPDLGNEILNETLREYLARFYQLSEKVDIYNLRIEEFSRMPKYEQKVRRLCCMNGIATHTAMCAIVEIGDFKRFPNAEKFSAFLGLVPGERSSGGKEHRTRITKHGNAHLRRLLVEAAQSYSRGRYLEGTEHARKVQLPAI